MGSVRFFLGERAERMGFRVLVVNPRGDRMDYQEVHVEWTDGNSRGRTGKDGYYDTGTQGTIKKIEVNGRTKLTGNIKVRSGDVETITI